MWSRLLDELNVVDVHAAARTALLVLLPTEAVKQRGSHLPLLVDIVARRDAAVRLFTTPERVEPCRRVRATH